jgi:hypothetical protein
MQEFLRCKNLEGVKVSWLKFTSPPKILAHLSNSFVLLLSKSTMKCAACSLLPRHTESKKLNHSGSISQNPGKFVLFWSGFPSVGAVVGVAASVHLWVWLPSGRAIAVPSAGTVVGVAVVAIVHVVARQPLCAVVHVAAVLSVGAVVGVAEGAVLVAVVGVVL